MALGPKSVSWLARGALLQLSDLLGRSELGQPANKRKLPQKKVNKSESGSSRKWQAESFSAKCRDFYLSV